MAFALSCKKEEVQKPLSLQGGKTAACSSGAAAAENSGVLFEVGNQNYASSDMAISFQQQKYENEISFLNQKLKEVELVISKFEEEKDFEISKLNELNNNLSDYYDGKHNQVMNNYIPSAKEKRGIEELNSNNNKFNAVFYNFWK